MALIAHHTKILHSPWYLKHEASSNVVTQRPSGDCHFICKKGDFRPLKSPCLVRFQPLVLQKRRVLRVLSFKGNAQQDMHGREKGGLKHTKSQVHISLSHQDGNDISLDTIDAEQHQVNSCAAEGSGDNRFRSIAIRRLFKKWLLMLRTPTSSSRPVDEAVREETVESTSCEIHHEASNAAIGVLRTALMYFIGVDAAITIPLLVFVPLYLSIRLVYGVEVTRELRPMWFLGPLVVAFYVKIVQLLCRLYYYLIIHAVQLVRSFPAYSSLAFSFVATGKLHALLYDIFCAPLVRAKNLDHWSLVKQKFKHFSEWATEVYLDFIESIWPYYCRTIRFLKRARLL